jgi:hydrogenase/urease accessory protein HupE
MSAQEGTINFFASGAYLVLSVPVSAFQNVDNNQDQQLSQTELATHKLVIQDQIQQKIQLVDKVDQTTLPIKLPAEIALLSLSSPDSNTPVQSNQLLVMIRFTIPFLAEKATLSDLQRFQLTLNLFGKAPNEQHFRVQVSRDPDQHILLFSPEQHTQVLFQTPFSRFFSFVLHGLDHILFGFDHLVFLFAVLSSAFIFKRWLVLLSGFTLAHATTYTLASLGWVVIPSAWVETMIALSIVFMATLQLKHIHIRLRYEGLLIFCFGLIHGLGFASAMSETGQLIEGQYPILSILGFNVGIEVGQLLVACVLWFSVKIFNRFRWAQLTHQWSWWANWMVLVLGLGWVGVRVFLF